VFAVRPGFPARAFRTSAKYPSQVLKSLLFGPNPHNRHRPSSYFLCLFYFPNL